MTPSSLVRFRRFAWVVLPVVAGAVFLSGADAPVRVAWRALVGTIAPSSATGILGYWAFDAWNGAEALDSSGNDRTGTITGGSTWTKGKMGNALRFDGIEGRVVIPDFDAPTSITLEAWIYPEQNTAGDSVIIGKHADEYDLRIARNGTLRGTAGGVSLSAPLSAVDFSALGTIKRWHHIVYVFDSAADTHKLYRNGVEIARGTHAGSIADMPNDLTIARDGESATGAFRGKIDNVKIHGRALSEADIISAYNLNR